MADTWKSDPRDANAHVLLDDAGDVVGSVMHNLAGQWYAFDAEGAVLGFHPVLAEAKDIVERHRAGL